MGEDAFELEVVQRVEQPGGDGKHGAFGARARGERVERLVVDDVELRLGEPGGDAEALDEVVEPQGLATLGQARAGDADRDPPGGAVGEHRDGDGEHHDDRDADDPEPGEQDHDEADDQHPPAAVARIAAVRRWLRRTARSSTVRPVGGEIGSAISPAPDRAPGLRTGP